MKAPPRKAIVVAASLLAVLAAGIFMLLDKTDIIPSADQQSLPPELEPHRALLEEIKILNRTDPAQAASKTRELADKLPQGDLRRWYELAFVSGIEEIRFFGKVVDQNGNALKGAAIHYEAAGKFLAAGAGRGSVASDANGMFTIETLGGSLTIENIRYPNAMYAALPDDPAINNRMYATGNTFWSYTRREGGQNLIWSDSSADNPVIFDLWVVDPDEAERFDGSIEWGAEYIGLPADGQPRVIDFVDPAKRFGILDEELGGGDLAIRCQSETMQARGDEGDWSVILRPVNGGIQVAADRYLNTAPSTGYQPSIEVGFQMNSADYVKNLFNQRYYFNAHGGAIYGSLYIDYEPFNLPYSAKTRTFGEQYCRLRIEYKVNSAGSPYLFKNRRLLSEVNGQ